MKVLFERRAYVGGKIYPPHETCDVPDEFCSKKLLPTGAKILDGKAARASRKPKQAPQEPMTFKQAKGTPKSFVEVMGGDKAAAPAKGEAKQ